MPNKIKQQTTLSITGTNISASLAGSITQDQVGSNFVHETQTADTTGVAMDFGTNIVGGKMGYLVVRNLEVLPVGETNIANGNTVTLYNNVAMAAVNEIGKVYCQAGIFVAPNNLSNVIYAKARLGNALMEFLAVEI